MRLPIVDNQWVREGDVLMELDARPYEAEAARARARLELVRLEVQALRDAIAENEAVLEERRARATYARDHYERLLPLLEGKFVSPDRVEKARSEALSTTALVVEGEAAVARARNALGEIDGRNTRIEEAAAALRDAELKVSFCRVTAPRDGRVTNLQIAPGSYAAVCLGQLSRNRFAAHCSRTNCPHFFDERPAASAGRHGGRHCPRRESAHRFLAQRPGR